MATIKDVAKKAGVSVCTVSRTLSGKGYVKAETRHKILDAVKELQYQPNKVAVSLKTGTSNVLALILPTLTNVYYPKLEKYIEQFANERGYMIYLCNAEYNLEKEQSILENICGQNIAGVIITPSTKEHRHIMKLKDYNIPYVYLNRYFPDDLENCIRIDNKKAAYNAVSYLIQCGHTSIGGIFETFDNMSNEERYLGMLEAIKEHGLPLNQEHLLFNVNDLDNSFITIRKMLDQKNRPEAIFACNDMLALGVYKAAYDLNIKIPDELSVFGYDNSIMANMTAPPLSTFDTPAKELSRTAIDFIDNYIKTGTPLKLSVLEGRLIIRNSVKKKR